MYKKNNTMGTNNLSYLFILLLSIFAFTACQQAPPAPDDSLGYLPEETAMVTAIKLEQMMEKADFDQLRQSEGFQKLISKINEEDPLMAKILQNPQLSGVDLNKNIYFAFVPGGTGDDMIALVTCSLSDPTAFKAMVDNTELSTQKVGNQNQAVTPDGRSVLVWDDAVALFGFGEQQVDFEEKIQDYLERKGKDGSIAKNSSLRMALDKNFDMVNWFASDFLAESPEARAGVAFLNYDKEDLKGSYVTHYLTFEQGAVRSEAELSIRGAIGQDINMLFNDEVSTDFLSAAPAGSPLFLLSAAFNMNGINQLLIEKYSKGLADGELKKYGLSGKEVLDAFQGDIFLAAYPSMSSDTTGDEPDLVFMAKIDKEESLQKMIDIAVQEGKLEQMEDGGYQATVDSVSNWDDDRPALLIADGLLYLSGDVRFIQQVQRGEKGLTGSLAEQGGQMLQQQIFTAIGNPEAIENLEEEWPVVESIQASATRNGTKALITLENATQNSLKTIIEQMQAAEAATEASEL